MNKKSESPALSRRKDHELGLDTDITRRDFIGGTCVGAGAALLSMGSPGLSRAGVESFPPPSIKLGPDWTGPGGTGEYSSSNGNTHGVLNVAHDLRNGVFEESLSGAVDTGESHDLVVVGGGFAGFGAALALQQEFEGHKNCLVLDNHAMYGGEAKHNEFIVDGYQIYGPQGSSSFSVLRNNPAFHSVWHDLGLPTEFEHVPLSGTSRQIRFSLDPYAPMRLPDRASIGYFFDGVDSGRQWVIDPHLNGFRDTPLSPQLQQELHDAFAHRRKPEHPEPSEQWLDSMTYRDFLVNELGFSQAAFEILDYSYASDSSTASGDICSAYYAYLVDAPGTRVLPGQSDWGGDERDYLMFPAGNAGIIRHFVQSLVPAAFPPDATFEDVVIGPTNTAALDMAGNSTRIRLSSTALKIEHDGIPEKAGHVYVTYYKNGNLERVRAKAVVVAIPGHIAKNVIRDLPGEIQAAYQEFHHAPQLVINVALTNWRFMETLGISAARWFEGFGWWAALRQPMSTGGSLTSPHDPSKPAVLTLIVPFLEHRGKSMEEQTRLGRLELFSRKYRDYEILVRKQLVRMFSAQGFDPRRDIAGIVLNRWGHASIAPQPGYQFGMDGKRPARNVVAEGYGRISFGHSEISGIQTWGTAVSRGMEAVRQLRKLI